MSDSQEHGGCVVLDDEGGNGNTKVVMTGAQRQRFVIAEKNSHVGTLQKTIFIYLFQDEHFHPL